MAAILISMPTAAQQGATADAPTRVTDYSSDYVVNQDGSFTETRSWSILIRKEQALATAKQTSVTYSRGIQRAEVLEAYTLKEDGRHLKVPKSNYQLTTNAGRGKDAPVFSDQETLTVVFPDVTVGDSVVFSYRVTAIEPLFPNHFSVWETFPKVQAVDHARVRVDFPTSLPLRFKSVQMPEATNVEKEGRHIVEWRLESSQPPKIIRRNYSAYDPESDPGVFLSTFRTYGEIAAAYGAHATPKAAVTERIQKLADEIAADKKTPQDIARVLYQWVAANITYAGNCIGLGAVVPHDLDFVLDDRIGDCKDHATLLQALLAAKGIRSTQALINANNVFRLPEVPVASVVNHVITFIPDLNIYADSTSDSMPFGMLSFAEEGKRTLLVDGYTDGTTTPVQPIGANEQWMKTFVKVKPDGSVEGKVDVSLKGQYAARVRAYVRNIPPANEQDLVKTYYRASGLIASGTFVKGPGGPPADTYQYSATFEVKSMLSLPAAGAFAISPMIFSEVPIAHFVAGAMQIPDEQFDSACNSGRSIEDYVFEFPSSMKIIAVPENFTASDKTLSYRASYVRRGRTLTVHREFDDRTKGPVCSPAEIAADKEFVMKVLPNFKAQVVYK